MAGTSLTPAQSAAIDAAGKRFNVDPRLIEAVYGKETSFGTNPLGIGQTDPFHAFGLIAGPGHYAYDGYTATSNTFEDAANTVASFFADERKAYDAGHSNGESFLQFADAVYSPPASNPDSYGNLTTLYKQLGGDPAGEAQYTGGGSGGWVLDPTSPNNIYNPKNWHYLNPADPQNYGDLAGAISNVQHAANDWILYATGAALFLALIGGGIAIMAGGGAASDPTVKKAAEGAAIV